MVIVPCDRVMWVRCLLWQTQELKPCSALAN
uniref:Uncharacterized protein n=1 Tax=Anguilla anguilla TaxID=7936 RepID=A0A0E9PPQ2_ANGAN